MKCRESRALMRGNPLNAPAVPAKQDAPARGWYVPSSPGRRAFSTPRVMTDGEAISLSLSPCGRGWRVRSDSEHEPGEGNSLARVDPLTRPRCARAPSPTRGEGKRASRTGNV